MQPVLCRGRWRTDGVRGDGCGSSSPAEPRYRLHRLRIATAANRPGVLAARRWAAYTRRHVARHAATRRTHLRRTQPTRRAPSTSRFSIRNARTPSTPVARPKRVRRRRRCTNSFAAYTPSSPPSLNTPKRCRAPRQDHVPRRWRPHALAQSDTQHAASALSAASAARLRLTLSRRGLLPPPGSANRTRIRPSAASYVAMRTRALDAAPR